MIDPKNLATAAANLLSEDGENPEYDRAIVELVIDSIGLAFTSDHKTDVESALRGPDPYAALVALAGSEENQTQEQLSVRMAITLPARFYVTGSSYDGGMKNLAEYDVPDDSADQVVVAVETRNGEPLVGLILNPDGSVTVGHWPDGEEWVVMGTADSVRPPR